MTIHGSIGRTALGALASAVLALGIGAAAEAQEPVKIGVTLTQSPPGSVIQGTEVLRGLEIARDLFNAQGGVLDRPFELIVEDTQGIPERGRAAVEITELDQTLEETTLLSAPDLEVQLDQLQQPEN